ncbi:hypothetical protein QFC22_002786 [Naganishia vaughanmartiniae]|uniref:Uncharacterized protein n=1 Tax=Naganishia vaughanmartiniae TaxID=1424756 RepID=A0ACC2XC37_9TREE|nr:hypothetical protein QFC22_002786 [Naganishia vaughanmartiniae]
MKFARYLEDNCTPEWKRAYIDYRKLKKCIKAIQRRQISGEAPGQITEADIPDSDEHQQDEERGSNSRQESRDDVSDDERRDTVLQGISAGHTASGTEERNRVDGENADADDDDADDDDDDDDDDSDTGPHAFPVPKKPVQGDDSGKTEPRKSRWLQHRKAELEGKLASPRLSIPTSSPTQSRSGSIAGYGSMGRTPPMHRHRAASPPVLVLPDPSNPEAGNTDEKADELPQTTSTRDADVPGSTPLAAKGKKHLHWDTAKTNGHNETPVAEEEGDNTAGSGSGSGSGRDSSSGDEDRILPLQKAAKSPRLLARSPSFLPKSPKLFGGKGAEVPGVLRHDSTRRTMSSTGGVAPRYPETIEELYKICYADERRFFTVLDAELEKVEAFYHERESDAIRRSHELQAQLKELAEHRRVFHEAEGERQKNGVRKYLTAPMQIAQEVQKRVPFVTPANTGVNNANGHAEPDSLGNSGKVKHQETDSERDQIMKEFDPEKYQRYKKKLKVAMVEHYKELEILKNYRILNLTGFKKALKKFEKTAKIRCIDLYMDEKVAKRSFADHRVVDALLKEVEDEYTQRFEQGDHKKALGRLRGEFNTKTHHLSTFWSGIYIGIGVPILILGLVQALQPGMSREFPQRDGLLVVYATLFLPVIFAMLFELNLTAYVSARINYPFIMELDVRTALDHRQFLEIPALLFAILSFCFYFSFHFTGSPGISPYAWPIVWVVFTVLFFINPLPVYYQHARYWLLSVLARVFTPGYSRVEFIAFFVADELNSLSYTFGNLWFTGCAYNKGWPPDVLSRCSSSHSWVYGLLLTIPALIRLIQCIKRWYDSRLQIHLINAGKYTSTVVQYTFYVYWRSRGNRIHDHSFALWATFASISSIYTSSWDLSVDWGLLRPRYGYLRESLGYPSIRHYYYVAMVLNVLIRFIWVWYIPASASYLRTRAFFFAAAEMLRRWQWNFFRVETEQVGNTDQYRVTREVPLPYHRLRDDEDLDEELEGLSKYGKEKGFSLRRAAFRLGDIREQLIRRRKPGKSAEPTAGARTSDIAENAAHRPSTSSGSKSLSVGINGAEEEVV